MHVTPHCPGDLAQLQKRVRREGNAKQRDRYRVVLLALEGLTEPQIRTRTARSRGFVQRWVYAYRDGGIPAITAKKPTGQPPKLPREKELEFQRLMEQPGAPRRGRDIQHLLRSHFGVSYSLRGAVLLLHRLGYVPLKPRPVNPKKDPAAEEHWRGAAPLLSSASARITPTSKSKSGSRTKADSARRDA